MIIKLLLTFGLALVLLYAISQRRNGRLFYRMMLLLSGVGVYFVWVPDQTTVIANAVGVGRGADLLLYGWIVISLVLSLSLNLKIRRQLEMITELTRFVALSNPAVPSAVEVEDAR